MKIQREPFFRRTGGGAGAPSPAPAGERGSAVVVFLALLAIMLMLVAANNRTLFQLHRELQLLDHRQVERLSAIPTNTILTVESPAAPERK